MFAVVATAYFAAQGAVTADGTVIRWDRGYPRILAASDEDVRASNVTFGEKVCVTFPLGDRITYTVRDVCPACSFGEVDLLVGSRQRAIEFGRTSVTVTKGSCNGETDGKN